MSVVSQGSPSTLALYAGETLTVTADAISSGAVVYVGQPGSEPGSPVPVAAGTTVLIGPYVGTRHYRIAANAGSLSYTTAKVDYPTAAEALAADTASRKAAVIAGGAAGDHTLAAIAVGDTLVSVIRYVGAGVAVTDVTDITSEFTVAAGKINNAAGTNTTGDKLLVLYNDLTP